MQLYQHPSGPRRNDFHSESTGAASAYTLTRHLLDAYTEQLYSWWSPEDLYLACFGDYATRPTRKGTTPPPAVVNKRTQALEDRVGYEVPELIGRMSLEELQSATSVLLTETLAHFILHVLGQERTIQYRLDSPASTRLKDDGHAKAAGLGKAPVKVAKLLKPVVARTPTPKPSARAVPVLRVAHSKAYWAEQRRRAQLALWPLGAEASGVAL